MNNITYYCKLERLNPWPFIGGPEDIQEEEELIIESEED